jgi:hypothetical protein
MLTQCRLTNGNLSQIAWIPTWAAKVGNEVELLPEGKFWAVREVFGTIDAAHLENQRSGRMSLGSIAVPTKS